MQHADIIREKTHLYSHVVKGTWDSYASADSRKMSIRGPIDMGLYT